MSTPVAEKAAPLDDVMLAMDVVDTLRHQQDIVSRELDAEGRERQLVDKLREIYRQQGIEVPDHILKEGVAALDEARFVYTPPRAGLKVALARLYVGRRKWGRWGLAIILALVVGLGGYFLVWKPYQASVVEQGRLELTERLPAEMDALYQTIYEETKVQTAANDAAEIRDRGKTAAKEGDRAAAEDAVKRLTALRDLLRQEYTLRIVNREGVRSGFWTIPEANDAATNYYITVEAIAPNGQLLSLPITNEETGETETVSMWGLRVPESIYNSVLADKQDDGIIQRNVVGVKQFGFIDVDYTIPVLGGAVTRW